ncbi:MAG TPA: malate/lactate/ureidoglycolate dehydrogenase [Buttiauxella sp.]|uniref:malate/lactate/ureidoglycolate dehydrogenase n=1 Tax=Buttiauxella sp. TaxID=1972222 RepID=UPI002B49F1E3|nr:malate/lactate/ureidoglycolate dehydrogenase [Buttiauxella sp.]HKM97000.1 malate/lactate/ureidoglycolate dehydrogenase [Buttiauxella sp.]
MPLFSHSYLRKYLRQHLHAAGVDAVTAGEVADNLVDSSLKGHDSHGVTLIPRYIKAIYAGELAPKATLQLTRDAGAILSFHGCNGFGQVLGRQAMEQAILRVKEFGVCVMGLSHTHHLGRIGAWAEQAAAAGLVSVHFANVGSRSMVLPFNGVSPRFGTNPFCIGVPVADSSPLVLDFATSMIAGNKARIAWNEGRELPPNCAVDNNGQPTRDPRWLMEEPLGALLAFGAHKGSGLALMCSLLGAAITGGETESSPPPEGPGIINNMLSIVFDPTLLGAGEDYTQAVTRMLEWTRTSRDDDQLLLPGDAEQQHYHERLEHGIEIDDVNWQQFISLEEASFQSNHSVSEA